jgi:hypothetical protein
MTEEALADLLYGSGQAVPGLDADEVAEAAATVRQMVLSRTHRGTGTVVDWFPQTLRGQNLDEMVRQFCRSPACRKWRERTLGISLEEAWLRFFEAEGIGDPVVREDEFFGAIVRALAVTPRARFLWPASLHVAPGGCFAITSRLVLHAAIDGRYLRGEITPLVASLLRSPDVEEPNAVLDKLRAMRLV